VAVRRGRGVDGVVDSVNEGLGRGPLRVAPVEIPGGVANVSHLHQECDERRERERERERERVKEREGLREREKD
jgi:hypothetical protein